MCIASTTFGIVAISTEGVAAWFGSGGGGAWSSSPPLSPDAQKFSHQVRMKYRHFPAPYLCLIFSV